MESSLPILILALLGLLILMMGAGLLLMLRGRNGQEEAGVLGERLQAREAEIASLRAGLEEAAQEARELRNGNGELREQLSRHQTLLEQERRQHEEKLKLLQNAREQMSLEFRNLANEILEQKGKNFTELNRESLQNLLNPLSEKIRLFEKKVEDTYDRESKERFSLQREIKSLQELNARISEDAVNLTNALKGESKTQGIWGEVILERILEKSGLCKGREYEVQVSMRGDDGRSRQPDVIVHLPENKEVIIDAKVSLSAYERYCSVDSEEERAQQLKGHIDSIRKHIKELSRKDYHSLEQVRSLDFVMMFLPVEAAFSLAVQQDAELFTEAFDQNIVLVGPSTLLATLRTIQNIWRYEYQNKNALDIARRAGALYNKFHGFIEDLEEVGQRIDQSRKAWDKAHNKLSSGHGNLVSHVEKLKQLGARANKQLERNLLAKAGAEALEEAAEGFEPEEPAKAKSAKKTPAKRSDVDEQAEADSEAEDAS